MDCNAGEMFLTRLLRGDQKLHWLHVHFVHIQAREGEESIQYMFLVIEGVCVCVHWPFYIFHLRHFEAC